MEGGFGQRPTLGPPSNMVCNLTASHLSSTVAVYSLAGKVHHGFSVAAGLRTRQQLFNEPSATLVPWLSRLILNTDQQEARL